MPNVSEEDYQERIDECFKCEHFLENLNRCGKCGCLVEYKARWKTTKCPIDKWKAQSLKSDEKNPEGNNTEASDEV